VWYHLDRMVASLLVLCLAGDSLAQSQDTVTKHQETCMPEEDREQMRIVMLNALDEALRAHVKNLFLVWLKDERNQPARAGIGLRQGIRAHQLSRRELIAWNPPECP